MEATIGARIKRDVNKLTASQRRIAEYVLGHWDVVAFMAAKELGEATGSSDAAIIRFAQALGFAGFTELRALMRAELIARAGSTGIARRSAATNGPRSLFQESFELDAALIDATMRLNDAGAYWHVAKQIVSADKVWVVAHGMSYPMGAYLAMHLNQALGKGEILTIGTGDTANRLRAVGHGHLVIGIAYLRYLPYTSDILRLSRARGATIIAITDSVISPAANLADTVLLAARDGVSFTWSQVGTMAIANLIIAAAALENGPRTFELLRQSDELWKDLGHWDGTTEPKPSLQPALGQGRRPLTVPEFPNKRVGARTLETREGPS